MTHAISVPTPFTDIAELAENFAQRVDEERVMLPNHEPIAEGEWVQFTVTFGDGSPALAGTGRCTGSYDNGEDREPEHRFDVVMDSLELDEMGQVYFERILLVRAQQLGAAEPGTGEVEVQEVAEIEASFVDGAEAQPMEEVTAFVQAPPEEAYAEPVFEEAPVDASADVASVDVASVEPFEAEDAFEAAPVELDPPSEDASAFVASSEAPMADAASFEVSPEEVALAEEPLADAEGADAGGFEAAPAAEVDAVAPLESGEWEAEPVQPAAAGVRGRSAERLAAPVAAIYELPPPSAPGQLPSPHENEAVLTRRLVEATWTPTPMLRPDPSPSSGYFQYGGGGLPQPAQPPRPAIDPALRIVPAPRPGDPLAAPMMRSAFDGSAAVAYADDVHEEQANYAEPPAYEEAVAHEAAGSFEGEAHEGALEGDFAEAPMTVDAVVDDAAFTDAPLGEEPIAVDEPSAGEEPIAVDDLDDALSFEESGDDEPR